MKRTMKRSICILLYLLISLALLSPGVYAATDSSRSYNFQLSVNGGLSAAVSVGDEITLEVKLERTDAGKSGSYAMYSMQDEIIYDSSYFSLVEGSQLVTAGYDFNEVTMDDGFHKRVILSRISYFPDGIVTEDSVVVASFKLKTLKPGDAAIISDNYKVNTKTADTYLTMANNVRITISVNAGPSVERLSGANRFETAVAISKAGWQSSDTVVLARADDYADALAGVSLAYKEGAPILLTSTRYLHATTKAEIERLQAGKVIVLGGSAAISEDVVKELKAMGCTVQRIEGANRFETAVAIANFIAPSGTVEAVLAYGLNFPDALSVASYAAVKGMPILLTDKNQVPQATMQAISNLGIGHLIVVGGTSAISDSSLAGLPSYTRVNGADRFGTAIALAQHFDMPATRIFVATGLDYPDAITGAALAAKEGCGMILVSRTVPDAVESYLQGKVVDRYTLLGGTTVISESVIRQLRGLSD